jgi:23S rRNA (cytosine1962-C5)-methyltransferase
MERRMAFLVNSLEPANPLILFEDDDLLVINKPAGWNTHAPSPYAGEGVYDWLKHREPRWSTLAIIHRLDKETSGVMVFGKSPLANRSLTEQFASRTAKKVYRLVTDRPVQRQEFTATSALVRSGEKYLSRPLHAGADRAETHFRVIDREPRMTVIEAEPITGRTHQIRVHAAEHGFPILGDTLYGGTPAARVCLHAAALELQHPAGGERMKFRAPCEIPDDGHLTKSRSNIDRASTSAWRVVHGATDGFPGWYVDKLGDWLLSQSEQPLTNAQATHLKKLAASLSARGCYHKLLTRYVRGSAAADASPQLTFGEEAPEKFTVVENGVQFELSFREGYSVGIFLDQRDNRRRFLVNYVAAGFSLFPHGGAGAEVLNTFAYTCGFSVVAAKAGARTTSLDLSKKYLEWGKRNFALNGIDASKHDFIFGDAFDWMRRLSKKGRGYDVIILDPPTFSQSKESGRWQAEKDFGRLVESALPLLRAGGVLFASSNAARFEPERFISEIKEQAARAGRKVAQQHYVPQPPDFPISRGEPAYLKTIWMRL